MMFLHRKQIIHAPEFPSGHDWINSKPLTLKSLRGKPVLLDFWTYSCVNCLRTFPYVQAWHKRYAKHGLSIIGVHTPEFEFEKDVSLVQKALKRHKITYPVVLDPDYAIWNLWSNRWWPRTFLLNQNSEIVYDHVGEGGYAQTEAEIQRVLSEIGVDDLPHIAPDPVTTNGICYQTTPETYLGFLRGRFGNAYGVVPGQERDFTDKGDHEDALVYLHGHWVLEKEYLAHTRALALANEYVAIKYRAFGVNLVAGSSKSSRKVELIIELDGHALPEDMAGKHVCMKNGQAIVEITTPQLYEIVRSDVYHHGTLKIKTGSSHLRMYAFTFNGCRF